MPVDEKNREALDLRQLDIPPELPISRIEVEDYTDSDGESSLRVLVVLDESVQIGESTGKLVGELKSRIHKSLRGRGVTVFPYIFLAEQSEIDSRNDEE